MQCFIMVNRSVRSVVLAALAVLAVSAAQAKTPFPAFTGERVYVAGVADVYAPVRAAIQEIQASSPQQYYVVVVQSSGTGPYATLEYVDGLFQAWLQQSRQQGKPLDVERSVVVVLAIENRQLAVHAGTVLQAKYGLQGAAIDRQLVQPYFIPHAKAGDHATGLVALLKETEKLIAAKDETARREAQEAVARAAEIRRSAESTLTGANTLRSEVAKELTARRDAGLDVKALQEQATKAGESLDKLTATLASDPQGVLNAVPQTQADLQRVFDALHGMAAVQTEAKQVLDRAEAEANRIELALEADRKNKLPVASVQKQLDDAWGELETADEKLKSHPDEAKALAQQAVKSLVQVEQQRLKLPALTAELEKQRQSVKVVYDQIGAELKQAASCGVTVDGPRARYEQAGEQLAALESEAAADPVALQTLQSIEANLKAQHVQISTLEQRHVMATKTLPAAGGGLVAAMLAATAGGMWLRRGRLKRQASERLEEYKKQVVQLLERLDALKQQHQYLPFVDKDFTEPMTGATLAAYTEVETMHNQLRERWLSMMDLRQRAEHLVETETRFGASHYSELLKLLADKTQPNEVEAIYQKCAEHLDRLGKAHERAKDALKSTAEAAARLREQLQTIAAARLATEPYNAPLQAASTTIEQARVALQADPLGVGATLEQVQNALKASAQRVERALSLVKLAATLDASLNEVAALAVAKRAEGLRLAEPDADPDPRLAKGHDDHQAAMVALNAADGDAAEQHLKRGQDHAARARQGIDRQMAARAFCQTDIPLRRQESERLAQLCQHAQQQQHELRQGFTPDTWQGVAESLPQATAMLQSVAPALEEAQRDAGDGTQYYLRAAERLGQIREQQQQVAARLTALGNRLSELVALRETCRARRKQLGLQANQVRQWIAQNNTAVRAEARNLLAKGEQEVQTTPEPSPGNPINWVNISTILDHAQRTLSAAQETAQADATAHQQLLAQLESTRQQAGQVDQLLRSNTADRARANQRFQAANQDLGRIRQTVATPQSDWAALAVQLKQVADDFEQARAWANDDIRLAQQAEAAIAEAEKHYQRARTYINLHASTNMSAAQSQLDQARGQLKAQAYEQAISLADSAERAARAAYDEAMRETQERQRRLERAQQRTIVVGAPVSPMFGGPSPFEMPSLPMPGAGGYSPSPPSAPPSPPPAPSTSSSSGWSSGSSQSSW